MALQGEYAPLDPQSWTTEQIQKWESSNGTEGTTLLDTGLPCVIVVNRGAKSGQLHRTPLMRVEHSGRYLAVGSKGGAPNNPAWVNNLRKHPEVEVWDGSHKMQLVARELDGDERTQWWDRAVDAFSNYAEYQRNTDRVIPIFILEPSGS